MAKKMAGKNTIDSKKPTVSINELMKQHKVRDCTVKLFRLSATRKYFFLHLNIVTNQIR